MPRKPSATINKSVTKQDFNKSPYEGYGGFIQLTLPFQQSSTGDLPAYWSPLRDRALKTTPMRESMWASSIGIATSKVAASGYRIDGRRISYWHDLVRSVDNNQSFVSFEEKQVRDYLLTDNGCFREIVRVNKARGARIVGVQHLPSWRCIRTGDPDIPVIYRDRRGAWHEMRDYQVVAIADEVDADDIFYGTGHCAASRAWNAIVKLSALELYVYEKIAGKSPSRIYFVNASLNEKQIQAAMDAQKEASNQKGYIVQQDAIIIPILDPSATASVAHVDLKGLPDNFEAEKERREAKLTYADAIGLDPLEIDPELATRGKSLGTGAQAQVLDDKQSGRGIISYKKKDEFAWNEFIFPSRVMFSFSESDLVDMGRRAEVSERRANAVRKLVGNGSEPPIITPIQGQQLLVDAGEISPEFLESDLTEQETLRSDEKAPLVLEIEHKPPPDNKLMQMEPKPEPQPMGVKPAPKKTAKESLNYILSQKSRDWEVNRAEEWAVDKLPNLMILEDDELLEIYYQNNPHHIVKQTPKETVVTQVITKEVSTPSQPQIVMVQPQAQPINIQMPDQLTLKEFTWPQINVDAPQVTLNQPPAQIVIQVPEVPAPIVNVEAPTVNVTNETPVTNVTVEAPNVNVTNDIPEQPVPQVTVNIPEDRTEVSDVIRDEDGLIQRIVKKITNG